PVLPGLRPGQRPVRPAPPARNRPREAPVPRTDREGRRSPGSAAAAGPGPAPRRRPGAGVRRRCHSRRPPGRAHPGRSCPGRKDQPGRTPPLVRMRQRCQGRRAARKDPRRRLVPRPHRPARDRPPRPGPARARTRPAVRAASWGREPRLSLLLRCGPGHVRPSWFPLSSHRYRRMTCRQGPDERIYLKPKPPGSPQHSPTTAIRSDPMRAVVITQPGGPEVLRLEEVPDPVPGAGEVLVKVAAAGLNRADVLQRQGHYPPPPGSPPYPGMECSGEIVELGPGVAGWQVGDEVCALLGGGAYAEKVAVPHGQLLPIPDGVSLVDAAALPEATCTIQGTVYQMAHAEGCTVACTAGSPEKLARCRELGADLAISYRDEDFTAAVLEFTGWHGADVILDIMGAPYLARNLDALATWGRLVGIATRGGSRAEIDLGLLMLKRATIVAATLRTRTAAEKAEGVAATREHI